MAQPELPGVRPHQGTRSHVGANVEAEVLANVVTKPSGNADNRCSVESVESLAVVLILAAGRSERFQAAGGQGNKLDAPFTHAQCTRPVLQHVMAAAQASGLPWHVVRPQDTAHLCEQGMASSIATGVAATAQAKGWLVLPGDLPLIQSTSLLAVAQALRQHHTVVPMVAGERGHPVGFSAHCREALLALRGEGGARSVLQQHPPHLLHLNDPGCTLDVDTPERLQTAQQMALGLVRATSA